MKNFIYSIITITVIGTLGCNPAKKSAGSTAAAPEATPAAYQAIGKKWQLLELRGKPVADSINGKLPLLQFNADEHRYSGNVGCNGVGGSYTLTEGNRIQFKMGMSTMMYCDQMEVETELKKVLEQADNYNINGNELSLNKARMAPLARFRAVVDLSANLDGTWELTYISGPRIAFEGLYPGRKPTISFNSSEKRVNGHTSCNNYNAPFSIDANNISFGDIASTKMACEGAGEATFLNTLSKITSWKIENGQLSLVAGDVELMRLKR